MALRHRRLHDQHTQSSLSSGLSTRPISGREEKIFMRPARWHRRFACRGQAAREISDEHVKEPCVPVGFRLPEVCPQIYAEMCTLMYANTTLFFDMKGCPTSEPFDILRCWNSTLIPAFRLASTDVGLEEVVAVED